MINGGNMNTKDSRATLLTKLKELKTYKSIKESDDVFTAFKPYYIDVIHTFAT